MYGNGLASIICPAISWTNDSHHLGPFHESFSIVIEIRRQYHSFFIQVVVIWSLWHFAQHMARQLYCGSTGKVSEQYHIPRWSYNKINFSSHLNYDRKLAQEMGRRPKWQHLLSICCQWSADTPHKTKIMWKFLSSYRLLISIAATESFYNILPDIYHWL